MLDSHIFEPTRRRIESEFLGIRESDGGEFFGGKSKNFSKEALRLRRCVMELLSECHHFGMISMLLTITVFPKKMADGDPLVKT
jgi:hypothetical protein